MAGDAPDRVPRAEGERESAKSWFRLQAAFWQVPQEVKNPRYKPLAPSKHIRDRITSKKGKKNNQQEGKKE